jgi:hypothetical protein
MIKDAKPNQKVEVICSNLEFVITVIVITEFTVYEKAALSLKQESRSYLAL